MKYFSHDVFARDNDKLFELIETHGMMGYGLWWMVLEELYKAEAENFQIEATQTWLKRMGKQANLTDWRSLVRVFDTMAEQKLIDAQLWAEHIIFSPGIGKRADAYMRKKMLNAKRQAEHREREKQKNAQLSQESNALRNAEFSKSNAVTPSYSYAYSYSEKEKEINPLTPFDEEELFDGVEPSKLSDSPPQASVRAASADASFARGEKRADRKARAFGKEEALRKEFSQIEIPECLNTPEFVEVWNERIDWAMLQPKNRRPALKSQIRELKNYHPATAVALVRRAMSWQGLHIDSYKGTLLPNASVQQSAPPSSARPPQIDSELFTQALRGQVYGDSLHIAYPDPGISQASLLEEFRKQTSFGMKFPEITNVVFTGI